MVHCSQGQRKIMLAGMDGGMSAYLTGGVHPHHYSSPLDAGSSMVTCGGGQVPSSPIHLAQPHHHHHHPQHQHQQHASSLLSGSGAGAGGLAGYSTSMRHVSNYDTGYSTYGSDDGTQLYPRFPPYDRLDVRPIASPASLRPHPQASHLPADYFRSGAPLAMTPTSSDTSLLAPDVKVHNSCRIASRTPGIPHHGHTAAAAVTSPASTHTTTNASSNNTHGDCSSFSSPPPLGNPHGGQPQPQPPPPQPQNPYTSLSHHSPAAEHHTAGAPHHSTLPSGQSSESSLDDSAGFTACSYGNPPHKYEGGESASDGSQSATPSPHHPGPLGQGAAEEGAPCDSDTEGEMDCKGDNNEGGCTGGNLSQATIYPWMRSQYGEHVGLCLAFIFRLFGS